MIVRESPCLDPTECAERLNKRKNAHLLCLHAQYTLALSGVRQIYLPKELVASIGNTCDGPGADCMCEMPLMGLVCCYVCALSKIDTLSLQNKFLLIYLLIKLFLFVEVVGHTIKPSFASNMWAFRMGVPPGAGIVAEVLP